jgi:hypothetical protein
MEVFALLFASKYGIAALGSVTLALGMLVSTFVVLARIASSQPSGLASHSGQR